MPNFYCEYCGQKYSDLRNLTSSICTRHPNGAGRGKHKLYEGGEKPQYFCKYCGQKYSDLKSLTSSNCVRHPNGAGRGKHAPAL